MSRVASYSRGREFKRQARSLSLSLNSGEHATSRPSLTFMPADGRGSHWSQVGVTWTPGLPWANTPSPSLHNTQVEGLGTSATTVHITGRLGHQRPRPCQCRPILCPLGDQLHKALVLAGWPDVGGDPWIVPANSSAPSRSGALVKCLAGE